MHVTVLGPNLSEKNQHKGSLHAHEASCQDIRRSYTPYERQTGDTIEVDTIKEIITFTYAPGSFNYDPDNPDEYAPYRSDIFVAPCVSLPE